MGSLASAPASFQYRLSLPGCRICGQPGRRGDRPQGSGRTLRTGAPVPDVVEAQAAAQAPDRRARGLRRDRPAGRSGMSDARDARLRAPQGRDRDDDRRNRPPPASEGLHTSASRRSRDPVLGHPAEGPAPASGAVRADVTRDGPSRRPDWSWNQGVGARPPSRIGLRAPRPTDRSDPRDRHRGRSAHSRRSGRGATASPVE